MSLLDQEGLPEVTESVKNIIYQRYESLSTFGPERGKTLVLLNNIVRIYF